MRIPKIPVKKIKTYLEVLIFAVLAFCVVISGYFFLSDPEMAVWELTHRDKVRQLKKAYEEVVDNTEVMVLEK